MAASSAYWTAALRARETGKPDRLFADEFAADLAGDLGRDLLHRKERRQGREDVLLPVRTRWFDDAVLDAVPAAGAQLVELGAGLDTRPYRLPLPIATRVFELDQESVLEPTKAEAAASRDQLWSEPCAFLDGVGGGVPEECAQPSPRER